MNDNTNQLFDLISSIQAKLNDNTTDSNNNVNNSENKKDNSTINNDDSTNKGFDFSNLDINTVIKIQSLLSNFNKNTPKKNLLYSLKPFLNKTRQDKLGEYITILSIIDAIDIFGKKGSDSNV